MKPKRRRPCNARAEAPTLPITLDDLARLVGGPFALVEQAERRAGDEEARFWLDVLEACDISEAHFSLQILVPSWIKSLRKRLGVRPTPDTVRAQTRERVRRYRERMRNS